MLKLGIIGLSSGNGHPYSWSAIYNGYNPEIMKNCPFPLIPDYLSKYSFPEDSISKASVTHIWTQDYKLSKEIAAATNIEFIAENYIDMIEKVDGIILARDDYQFHRSFAKNIIPSGLPIYIDKPLATSTDAAKEILSLQKYPGQVFTASALAYDPRLKKLINNIEQGQKIKFFSGIAPGNWDKYSVHLIDCFLKIIKLPIKIKKSINFIEGNKQIMNGSLDSGESFSFVCLGGEATPIKILVVLENESIEISFQDPFLAFKSALEIFTENIDKKSIIRSEEEILSSIKFISLGMR